MERRKFAHCRVDLLGTLRIVARIHVRFVRLEGNRRQLHGLRVNGLAADDDDLGITRDLTGGPNDMFELSAIHKWRGVRVQSVCR